LIPLTRRNGAQENKMAEVRNEISGPPMRHGWFLLIVVFLVYVQAVGFPFLDLDDTPFIVNRPETLQWSALPHYFTGQADDVLKINYFYRPIVSSWILLNYHVFGFHPGLWHLAAIMLYCLGVWLVWRVAWKLTRDDWIALMAALLYGLHPLHAEGVAWISGATVEPLLSVLFLGGFLAYLRWREDRRPVWMIVCGVLTMCALLSKETAAALPVLILAHALIFRSSGGDASSRTARWLWPTVTMGAVSFFYALLRISVTHAVVMSHLRHSWGDVFRTAPLLNAIYLRQAVWPAHLGGWYDVAIVNSLGDRSFYLPLAAGLLSLVLLIWASAEKRLAGFLLLWWVVLLAPSIVGILSFSETDLIHDRFVFLPLVGLCILAAGLLRRLPAFGPLLFGFKATGVAVAAVLTIVLALLTTVQVSTWKSGMVLYAHAIEVSPGAVKPRIFLASEYIKRHDLAQALAVDRDGMNINPNQWQIVFHYGMTLATAGYREDGVRQLYRAVQLAPKQNAPYYGLGAVLADAGRFDQSIKVLEQGISAADAPAALREKLAQVKARAQAAQQRPAANR
jgi:dolichyl-phosphate-mannose-protein mannosyltransferase